MTNSIWKKLLLPLWVLLATAGCNQAQDNASNPTDNAIQEPAPQANPPQDPAVQEPTQKYTVQVVEFMRQDTKLHGWLYTSTQGSGPFPAVIHLHGGTKDPGEPKALGEFYTSQGYVFFAPNLTGAGLSADAGPFISDITQHLKENGLSDAEIDEKRIGLLERFSRDGGAAAKWLKQQPNVDHSRIFMTGHSMGGQLTLLVAEKNAELNLGIRAFLAFSPGAAGWNDILEPRLIHAVTDATAPIFLMQPEGDLSLSPSQVLGPILQGKGAPNGYKVYPTPFEDGNDAHNKFANSPDGIEIWSADAMNFFQESI
ncbi:MAG: acetylxylan esterase [bacterium]